MTELLAWSLLAVGVLNAALLVFVLLRRSDADASAALQLTQQVKDSSERLERELRR